MDHPNAGGRERDRVRAETAINRVQAFHALLRALLRESVIALEEAEGDGDAAALASLRWRFVRALREYQLFKHTEIFDPIIRAADQPRAGAASDLKGRCLAVGQAYNDHVRRWNLGGTGSTPAAYMADARRMVREVGEHLTREEAGIRRLLAGVERTRGG